MKMFMYCTQGLGEAYMITYEIYKYVQFCTHMEMYSTCQNYVNVVYRNYAS